MSDIKYIGPQRKTLKTVARPTVPMWDWHKLSMDKGITRDLLPILAFDPGGTTGWSKLYLPMRHRSRDTLTLGLEDCLSARVSWEHGEIDCYDEDLACYHLMRLIAENPTAAIVVEDFVLRTMRREMARALLSPVRITAKIEHMLWRAGRQMHLQSPSLAKTTVTDERLKLWNCYQPGMQHARDADRHVITFVRRCYGPQGIPIRSMAWPHAYNAQGKLRMIHPLNPEEDEKQCATT